MRETQSPSSPLKSTTTALCGVAPPDESCPRGFLAKTLIAIRALPSVCRTLSLRNPVARWRQVSRNPDPVWDSRNQVMAKLIAEGSSVLDIGCGAQTLRRHLPRNCHYQPCDLIKSTPDVIVCDFNASVYPVLERSYDYVVCSGVMEYILDPGKFLDRIGGYGSVILLSYHPFSPGLSKWARLAANWVNHLSESELSLLVAELGYQTETLHRSKGECIYRLQRIL